MGLQSLEQYGEQAARRGEVVFAESGVHRPRELDQVLASFGTNNRHNRLTSAPNRFLATPATLAIARACSRLRLTRAPPKPKVARSNRAWRAGMVELFGVATCRRRLAGVGVLWLALAGVVLRAGGAGSGAPHAKPREEDTMKYQHKVTGRSARARSGLRGHNTDGTSAAGSVTP